MPCLIYFYCKCIIVKCICFLQIEGSVEINSTLYNSTSACTLEFNQAHRSLSCFRFLWMWQNLQEASMRGDLEEQRRLQTQKELLDQYRRDLEQEKMVTATLTMSH